MPSRSRSRSPRPSKKSSSSGFRWKEKPRRDLAAENEPRDSSKRLERGYRDREDDYERRRNGREREREGRDRDDYGSGGNSRKQNGEDDRRRDRGNGEREGRRERDGDGGRDGLRGGEGDVDSALSKVKETTTAAPPPPQQQQTDTIDIASKFGPSSTTPSTLPSTTTLTSTTASTIPSSSTIRPPASTGPMIIIKINDRLGTTTKVPCLASDSIGDLKKLVAMRIGRKPHEIMLKRQSERPFKDFLSLADYGVSDGVQLDLEIDTGG